MTTLSQIKPGQQFHFVGTQYATVREYSKTGTGMYMDLDLDETDVITLVDHGDADGPLVKADRDSELIEGILRLDAWAEVERVLPKTGLEFTEGACYVFNHVHRTVDGYTLCDSTGTYWS